MAGRGSTGIGKRQLAETTLLAPMLKLAAKSGTGRELGVLRNRGVLWQIGRWAHFLGGRANSGHFGLSTDWLNMRIGQIGGQNDASCDKLDSMR